MPELPEVETVVRDLRPLLISRTIRAVRAGRRKLRSPWNDAWGKAVHGARIDAIDRRGKWIIVRLDSDRSLLLHLGMTGQLTVRPADATPEEHTHLRFELDQGKELRFRDVRRFGSATLFESSDRLTGYLDDRLGPEPFNLDSGYLFDRLKSTSRPLKAALLDQKLIAGVGNIYADESCHLAGVHPGRRSNTMTWRRSESLRQAVERVLTRAIEGRGSTIRDYIGGSGLAGQYQNEFAVYGRTGEPCPTCGTAIAMTRIAGRSSHYCRRCQS